MNWQRVVVTGATGFVGRRLVKKLREAVGDSDAVVAVGSTWQRRNSPNGQIGSLADPSAVDELIAATRPSLVLHLGAHSSIAEAHKPGAARAMHAANVLGTMNLADAVRKRAPGARFVFASSGEVYGAAFANPGPLTETSPVLPTNPYARSKLAAEMLLQDCLSDVCPVIVLRLMNHTGAGQDERFVVPSFAAQIARIEAGLQQPILKVGNLTAERDFLDVDDVVAAYLAICTAAIPLGYTVYNVSSGAAQPIRGIVDALIREARVPIEVEIDPSRLRPSDIARAVTDSSRLRSATGWRPAISWNDTLAAVLAHARGGSGTRPNAG
jgi:GDP-4-dehydro-6-deoxy-D-mannose reductase